ncbi:hypothetical protein M2175_004592 [Bradyrhizobium elkanii]|uniref:hypothetical protein n=1 Tax=Bradyrhizobium TaxID=374 RepID=UPI00385747EC|nr:hypothetical protein [Bradyrhizobium elkanii]MCS3970118.1 hypothetical protein [Bradyrhizobium japonicum]
MTMPLMALTWPGKLSHYFDVQVRTLQTLGFQSPERNTRRTLPSEYVPLLQHSVSSQFREFGVFDAEMTALLRAVLDEVCENIPVSETGARAYVASKLLDAAAHGQLSTDALKAAGREAPAGKGDPTSRAGNRKAEALLNSADCQEHADHYKRLSGASGISKDRAAALKNIARSFAGLAGQLDRLAVLARDEQR